MMPSGVVFSSMKGFFGASISIALFSSVNNASMSEMEIDFEDSIRRYSSHDAERFETGDFLILRRDGV